MLTPDPTGELRREETLVVSSGSAPVPTGFGVFAGQSFTSFPDGLEHLAMSPGEVGGENVLTRVHSECLTGDVFGSLRCDCGAQLKEALRCIADEGRGVLIYLRGHEGRGIGLGEKLRAYRLQDQGLDTAEANLELGHQIDERRYEVAAQVLSHLGVRSVVLMTNNPEKMQALEDLKVEVVGRRSLWSGSTKENDRYLATKRDRLGHFASGDE